MLKFMDGFDQFLGAPSISDATFSAGYVSTGTLSIEEGRKTGTRCVQFDGSISRTFTSSAQRVVIGFAYKATKSRGDIVSIKDVATLGWSSVVNIGGTNGTAIPLVDLWYYYELVIDKAAKEIRVYINNELDLTAALPDTATFIQDYEVTWFASVDDDKQLDDLVMIDSSAGKMQDRVGPVQLALRLPRADVVSEFSPSNGTQLFPMVNKVPAVDGNNIVSNVSGAAATFRSTDAAPDGDLLAVGMVVQAQKSDIDGRQVGLLVGDAAGVNTEVIQPTLSLTPTFSYAVFETTPRGDAWNTDNMNTTPFGVKVRP